MRGGVRLLRIDEVARSLGCSRRKVFALIASGKLRAVRLSKRATRIPEDELLRFVYGAVRS